MVMLKIREPARSRGGNWGGIALNPAPAPHERNRNVEEMRAHEEGKYSDQYHAQHWNTENAHADGPRQLHSVGRALTVAAEAAAVTLTGPTRGTEAQRCAAQHSSYHHLVLLSHGAATQDVPRRIVPCDVLIPTHPTSHSAL